MRARQLSPALADANAGASDDGVGVLLLSLGTTRGLRVADADLLGMLREAGATAAISAVGIGLSGHLRIGYPFNDIIEGYAARRALRAAIERHRPKALILATSTNTLLTDTEGLPFAAWFDSPGRLNRHGARNTMIHLLERRSFGRASVLMPWSEQAMIGLHQEYPPVRVISPPIAESGVPVAAPRESLVVAYTPEPIGKGLELVCRAWSLASAGIDARLQITGITADHAHRFLKRRGLVLPPGVELPGMLSQDAFHSLLNGARVLLSGAKWEDFGQAPLEAMDRGVAFVAAPGGGPFPARALTQQLSPRFVAKDMSPAALADAIKAALGTSDAEMVEYRTAARRMLGPYRRDRIVSHLRDEVLPLLLA